MICNSSKSKQIEIITYITFTIAKITNIIPIKMTPPIFEQIDLRNI